MGKIVIIGLLCFPLLLCGQDKLEGKSITTNFSFGVAGNEYNLDKLQADFAQNGFAEVSAYATSLMFKGGVELKKLSVGLGFTTGVGDIIILDRSSRIQIIGLEQRIEFGYKVLQKSSISITPLLSAVYKTLYIDAKDFHFPDNDSFFVYEHSFAKIQYGGFCVEPGLLIDYSFTRRGNSFGGNGVRQINLGLKAGYQIPLSQPSIAYDNPAGYYIGLTFGTTKKHRILKNAKG
ncbi:MAG: hypothetical protein JXQ90_17615 [Cyclobacteriaceae bacterium]